MKSNMKNKFLSSIYGVTMVLALLIAAIPNPTFAATKGGVNSGSIFYTFDILLEKANLAFTFNKEKVVHIMNHTPRKSLNWRTPTDVFKSLLSE